MKNVYILGGGTFSHVRSHLALCAPAFGNTARDLFNMISMNRPEQWQPVMHLTKMADHHSKIVTNDDVNNLVTDIINDVNAGVVFFNVAMCDFEGSIVDQNSGETTPSGKYATRLKTADDVQMMKLTPSEKVIRRIRKHRKDIYLIGFKTTSDASEHDQYIAGLNLLKANSCNLVLANDLVSRTNMIIVPEEARYCTTTNRHTVLTELLDIAHRRSRLHFTRSTVIDGPSVDWNSADVPDSLRQVVNHCIERGAYKPFRGSTAGHFAYKVDDETFITSKRKTNFNELDKIGMVKVVSSGPDSVIAHGAKPSVGGQSQRIVFKEHPEADCIVHFHCPPKITRDYKIPVRQQKYFECGSHECGENTSRGLREVVPGIKAVYLDQHGPNVVFNRDTDPALVINFIEQNFDLEKKTGGLVA